jgi:hypothetical protein
MLEIVLYVVRFPDFYLIEVEPFGDGFPGAVLEPASPVPASGDGAGAGSISSHGAKSYFSLLRQRMEFSSQQTAQL